MSLLLSRGDIHSASLLNGAGQFGRQFENAKQHFTYSPGRMMFHKEYLGNVYEYQKMLHFLVFHIYCKACGMVKPKITHGKKVVSPAGTLNIYW